MADGIADVNPLVLSGHGMCSSFSVVKQDLLQTGRPLVGIVFRLLVSTVSA